MTDLLAANSPASPFPSPLVFHGAPLLAPSPSDHLPAPFVPPVEGDAITVHSTEDSVSSYHGDGVPDVGEVTAFPALPLVLCPFCTQPHVVDEKFTHCNPFKKAQRFQDDGLRFSPPFVNLFFKNELLARRGDEPFLSTWIRREEELYRSQQRAPETYVASDYPHLRTLLWSDLTLLRSVSDHDRDRMIFHLRVLDYSVLPPGDLQRVKNAAEQRGRRLAERGKSKLRGRGRGA